MTATDLSALARNAPGQAAPAAAETIPPPKRRWRTRVLLPGAILLTTVGLLVFAAGDALWPATPVRVAPVLVKSDTAAQPEGSVVVQAPGWVEPDPFPIAISALANGVVEELLVLEGQPVEAGQAVARLVAEDAQIALAHAEAVLAEREASLSAARAALDEAQTNWDHPTELTRALHTAQAELVEKRAALERWPAELAREEARAVYLKAEYERVIPLHESGQSSEIELIRARQDYETQRAQVETTRRHKPVLEAQIQMLEAEVTAAQENLELRIADTRALADARARVQQAEAAVASARALHDEAALRLERMEVRAPVAGVAMVPLVEPGSKVMLGSDNPRSAQIVRIYDPKKLQVRVDIPLVDAAKVGVGQPAEVIVDVLPDRVYRGEVTRVVNEADIQKNTLQVKVAIEAPTPEIKPEMLARARFLSIAEAQPADGTTAPERLFVPQSAIVDHAGQAHVWLADQVTQKARRRAVTVGRQTTNDWVVVTEGLLPGDRVVLAPPADLTDGRRIRLIEE